MSDTTSIKRDAPTPLPERTLENLSAADRGVASELSDDSALLLVQKGPNAGARYLLNSNITTVGRNPESDIFLDDVTVSRKHATINFDRGFTFTDAGSLNGSYLNNERASTALLKSGDEIQIGKFHLVFISNKSSSTNSQSNNK